MKEDTENCYKRYFEKHQREFSEDEFSRAKLVFDRIIGEIETRFREESDLFDCYSRGMHQMRDVTLSLSESELLTRLGTLRSDVMTATAQFFSTISGWLESSVETMQDSLRPLKGVSKRLKSMLVTASKDRILALLNKTIARFLSELETVAKRLGVENYSIGVSVFFVQLSLTFKVA